MENKKIVKSILSVGFVLGVLLSIVCVMTVKGFCFVETFFAVIGLFLVGFGVLNVAKRLKKAYSHAVRASKSESF